MSRSHQLPKSEFLRRIERTQELLRDRDFRGLIAFSSYQERQGHVAYLTNHFISFPNVMSHAGWGYAAVVLPEDNPPTLVAPMGYEADKVHGIDVAKTEPDLLSGLADAIEEKGLVASRLAIVGSDVVPAEYYNRLIEAFPEADIEPADSLLESQRIRKSPAEIELLCEAAHIADVALEAGMKAVRTGGRQSEIELAARRAALEAGADFIPRIRVASNPVSTLRWPMFEDRALEEGDFVYLDLAGWCGGYGFDNSRVTTVGRPSDVQKDYLEHLVDATEWMIEVMEPGKGVEYVFTESRARTITPFGHGIGLEICENPLILMGRRVTLEAGLVVSVKPAVLDRAFGGMSIADTVLITKDDVRVLNRCPRRFW